LEETPALIWDEMAYFAGTTLFFDPKSIKVSLQEPEVPRNHSGLSPTPVAKLSRVSPSNNIKGLLYVWGPQ